MKPISYIEKKALELILAFGGNKTEIDVFNIANNLNLEIKEHELGDNVSGVLYIEKGKGVIGCSPNQSLVRKRFTVAHEIGHYVLHRMNQVLFVDHNHFKPVFRDNRSSTGEFIQEREANAFAAALLMPKQHLINTLNKTHFDLAGDDDKGVDVISLLAKEFNVSTQAMAYRMSNLNLF